MQAEQRLAVAPQLKEFRVDIVRLPLERLGEEALKPFGYDLFAGIPTTFAPATDVPVPAEYVVGPGDQIRVQLYGDVNQSYLLTVGRDGRIDFPELGPVEVAGQTFTQVRQDLESRVARQMIGTVASVSMGETRSIRVFVLGEAYRPGSYTVSGLSTITNALFVSGGVKEIGSLRNIQLKRRGQVVSRLDLYDLLLRGDTTDDARLLPGDVIFIPPVGKTVDGHGRSAQARDLRDRRRDLAAADDRDRGRPDGRRGSVVRAHRAHERAAPARHGGRGPRAGRARGRPRIGRRAARPADPHDAREFRARAGTRLPAGRLPVPARHADLGRHRLAR